MLRSSYMGAEGIEPGMLREVPDVNSRDEIEKMRRNTIEELIENGTITNPEAVLIVVKKLQAEREAMKKEHEADATENPEEKYDIAAIYAKNDAVYEKVLIGSPPDPIRFCLEKVQERTHDGYMRSGYDGISAEQKNFPLTDSDYPYSSQPLKIAAQRYTAAGNWCTMAAKLAERREAPKS